MKLLEWSSLTSSCGNEVHGFTINCVCTFKPPGSSSTFWHFTKSTSAFSSECSFFYDWSYSMSSLFISRLSLLFLFFVFFFQSGLLWQHFHPRRKSFGSMISSLIRSSQNSTYSFLVWRPPWFYNDRIVFLIHTPCRGHPHPIRVLPGLCIFFDHTSS